MSRSALFALVCTLPLVACEGPSPSGPRPVDAPQPAPADTRPAEPSSIAEPDGAAPPTPQPVRARRPSQSQAESRLQAFYAVWGVVPPVTIDTPSGRKTFSDGEVAYFGGGRAMLVAYGDAERDAEHGAVALRYLVEGPDGLLEAGPGRLLVIEGGLGRIGRTEWAIRRDLMRDPVMIIEHNGPWGDYSCVGADLVALTDEGPVLLQPGDRRVRPLPNPDDLPLC